jgi:hypothetical protein
VTQVLRGLLFLALIAVVCGCNDAPSLIGVWRGNLFNQDVVTEFKEDKTLTIGLKDGEMGATFSGTYALDPKNLTITIGDYKLKSLPDTLDALAKQLFDPMKGKVYKLAYHFNSPNDLAVTYHGKVDVLKREQTDQ